MTRAAEGSNDGVAAEIRGRGDSAASPRPCPFGVRGVKLFPARLALLLLLASAFADGRLLALQGMASGRVARPGVQVKTDKTPPEVNFEDIAEKAGLTAVNVFGGIDTKKYIVETTGNGAAVFDFDNDGLMDLFLPNGGTLATAAPARTTSTATRAA